MGDMKLEVPPVGIKVLKSLDGFENTDVFCGASYCEAVKCATAGKEVLVTPESIEVCRWSPVILGFKPPESRFEKGIGPRIEEPVSAYYIAPMPLFRKDRNPDVVIVRGRPEQLKAVTEMIGEDSMTGRYRGEIGKTALGVGESGWGAKVKITHVVNRILAGLRGWNSFDRFTRFAFRSGRVSSVWERIIKNTMGDMSTCRNSTVIPYLEDAANVSFFCTGGIVWGANEPSHLTSGLPGELYHEIKGRLDFPGRI